MKEPVHNIETQFVVETGSEFSGLALRRVDADDDLAMLKRDHVRRGPVVHEPPMNFGNPFVGDQRYLNFFKIRQPLRFPSRLLEARSQCPFGEIA